MKMKEVCERTGLTERTVRFYMQKGLISPSGEWRNGREYSDFSEEDIELLRAIATLRELSFSIEDILSMQRDAAAIPSIVSARREAAREEHQSAENAYAVLSRLDAEGVSGILALAGRAREAAAYRPHPLPPKPPEEINQSGMGERCNIIPLEIQDKWNWGAFLFPIIWGLANHVYQALLCLIPVFGLFYNFYLGSRGNVLAWKHKYWESVARFRQVQRRWALISGLVAVALLAANIGISVAERRAEQQAEALEAERMAAFEEQFLTSAEWAEFIGERQEWTAQMNQAAAKDTARLSLLPNPTDAFYLDPEAYYRIRDAHYFNYSGGQATVAGSGEVEFNSSGAYMTFTCMVELSNAERWLFYCDADENARLLSILPELDAQATKEGREYVASVMQAAEDTRNYIERKTAEVTAAPLWLEVIGTQYEFIEGPYAGYVSYGPVYEGKPVELGGWYCLVRAGEKTWYAEIPLAHDETGGYTEQPLLIRPE